MIQEIIQFFQFFVSQRFYLILIFIGLIFLAFGSLQIKIDDKTDKKILKTKDNPSFINWLLIIVGLLCMIVSLVTALVSWMIENNINIDKEIISEYDGVILSFVYGFLSLSCIALLFFQINRLDKQRRQLFDTFESFDQKLDKQRRQLFDTFESFDQKQVKQQELLKKLLSQSVEKITKRSLDQLESKLLSRIEEATRQTLLGFPEIFSKSLELIQQADEQLIMVNFVLNFGEPHLCTDIKDINLDNDFAKSRNLTTDTLKKLDLHQSNNEIKYDDNNGKDSFREDVRKFFLELTSLIQDKERRIKIDILTANNQVVKSNFLNPLRSDRVDYKSLMNDVVYYYKLDQIESKKKYLLETAKENRSNKENKEFKLFECESMPFQLLIAGLKNKPGREGCLVFMVGTEILQNIKSGEEFGFYTELDPVVNLFKNLALALMKNATKIAQYP